MLLRIRASAYRDDFVKSPYALLRDCLRRVRHEASLLRRMKKYASLLVALRASHLELFTKPYETGPCGFWKELNCLWFEK